uniref:Putative scaffold/matrix specific factor hnrnp-u/saf-a n=1 Tax=Ixodes ricinus TaxID=34613 RepID=A0A0K8RAJ9_IXORI
MKFRFLRAAISMNFPRHCGALCSSVFSFPVSAICFLKPATIILSIMVFVPRMLYFPRIFCCMFSNPGSFSSSWQADHHNHFTIFLLFRALWTSNTVLQGNILDESIVLRYWKIWLFLLTKIELDSAVVAPVMALR